MLDLVSGHHLTNGFAYPIAFTMKSEGQQAEESSP